MCPGALGPSIDNDLEALPGLQGAALLQSVEQQEMLERPVRNGHASSQTVGRIAGACRDDLDARRMGLARFLGGELVERSDGSAKSCVDGRRQGVRGEDEPI